MILFSMRHYVVFFVYFWISKVQGLTLYGGKRIWCANFISSRHLRGVWCLQPLPRRRGRSGGESRPLRWKRGAWLALAFSPRVGQARRPRRQQRHGPGPAGDH
ncbi:hypothetical protein A7K93_03045, partial [Candidatus Methylacidiphilum fumarolicum]